MKAIAGIITVLFLTSMLSMAFNIAPVAALDNVVGLWHFDEVGGPIAQDSSGYNNHGMLSGGAFGNALKFDGVDDYVNIPDDPTLDITGDITLEAWIWIESFSTSEGLHMYIVGKDTTSQRSYGIAVDLTWMYPKTPAFIVFDPTAYYKIAWGTTTLATKTWYHIAGVYYASTGDLKLYVNGVLESTEPSTITSIKSGTADLRIGAREYPGHRSFFNGIIDEVRISNIPRTSFDLTVAPSVDADTVGLWHFDEGSGQIVGDETGVNDGQLGSTSGSDVNDPTWTGVGPTWTTLGAYDGALQFDGSDDRVEVMVSAGSTLEPTHITVESWVKNIGTPKPYDYIVGKDFMSGWNSYALYTGGTGGLFFYISHAGGYVLSPDAGPDIWDGDWHHIVGTFDGSKVRLYVDGYEVGTGTSTAVSIGYNLGKLAIGASATFVYNGKGYAFPGVIDEVRIWDTAISADDVYSSYTSKRKVLPIAGPVVFTSAFRVATGTTKTIKIYIWPSDPSVTIDHVTTNPKRPYTPKTRSGGFLQGTKGDWYIEVDVWQDSTSPCKTIHLWLYLSTGEHLGVNVQFR